MIEFPKPTNPESKWYLTVNTHRYTCYGCSEVSDYYTTPRHVVKDNLRYFNKPCKPGWYHPFSATAETPQTMGSRFSMNHGGTLDYVELTPELWDKLDPRYMMFHDRWSEAGWNKPSRFPAKAKKK